MKKTILMASLTLVTVMACKKMTEDSKQTFEKSANQPNFKSSEDADYIFTFASGETMTWFLVADDPNGYTAYYELSEAVAYGSEFNVKEVDGFLEIYNLQHELLETLEMPDIVMSPSGYPGNCDLLGPRVSGESFSDCVGRNINNFCCDLTGCVAFALNPGAVLTASGLSCIFGGSPYDYLTQIYDVKQNQIIY